MNKRRGGTRVNIELDKAAFQKRESANIITDFSRLLESPKEQHKVKMMTELKWDQGIKRTQAQKGEEVERNSIMNSLHSTVAKLDEIRDIAVTYDLKFLCATAFLCPEKREYEMTSMLSDFMEERKIDNNAFSKNSFYILADERYFTERCVDIDDEIGVFIFYLPTKKDGNFVRVNYLGDDNLTWQRWFRGWRRKEAFNACVHVACTAFVISFPVFGILTGGGMIRSFFASLMISVLSCFLFIHGTKKSKGGFTAHTWNKLPPSQQQND